MINTCMAYAPSCTCAHNWVLQFQHSPPRHAESQAAIPARNKQICPLKSMAHVTVKISKRHVSYSENNFNKMGPDKESYCKIVSNKIVSISKRKQKHHTLLELLVECCEDCIGILASVFLMSPQSHLRAEQFIAIPALESFLLCGHTRKKGRELVKRRQTS